MKNVIRIICILVLIIVISVILIIVQFDKRKGSNEVGVKIAWKKE